MDESGCRARTPRLSIVIPAPRDTAALEETLVSVLERRPDDCEVVVVLGCDYSDPWNIAEEVRFVQAPRGATLVSCVNVGAAASRGDVIHVLAAGWLATDGWTDAPLSRLADDAAVAAVVPVGVAADDRERVVSAGVRCCGGGRRQDLAGRRRWLERQSADGGARPAARIGPVLEAGFWRAETLALAGGPSVACGDDHADADLAVAVACAGGRTAFEPSSRVVAAARPRGRGFRAGLAAERLFWRSLVGRSVVAAVVLHAIEVVRHAVTELPLGTVPMLLGRVVGFFQFGGHFARAVQLRRIARQVAEGRTVVANPAAVEADHTAMDEGLESPTIRIDAAHAGAGRPRGGRVPLRKSA
jgi:hypothetical protein